MNETTSCTQTVTALRVAATASALGVLEGSLSAVGAPPGAGDSPMLTFCFCTGSAVAEAFDGVADAGRAA